MAGKVGNQPRTGERGPVVSSSSTVMDDDLRTLYQEWTWTDAEETHDPEVESHISREFFLLTVTSDMETWSETKERQLVDLQNPRLREAERELFHGLPPSLHDQLIQAYADSTSAEDCFSRIDQVIASAEEQRAGQTGDPLPPKMNGGKPIDLEATGHEPTTSE